MRRNRRPVAGEARRGEAVVAKGNGGGGGGSEESGPWGSGGPTSPRSPRGKRALPLRPPSEAILKAVLRGKEQSCPVRTAGLRRRGLPTKRNTPTTSPRPPSPGGSERPPSPQRGRLSGPPSSGTARRCRQTARETRGGGGPCLSGAPLPNPADRQRRWGVSVSLGWFFFFFSPS